MCSRNWVRRVLLSLSLCSVPVYHCASIVRYGTGPIALFYFSKLVCYKVMFLSYFLADVSCVVWVRCAWVTDRCGRVAQK